MLRRIVLAIWLLLGGVVGFFGTAQPALAGAPSMSAGDPAEVMLAEPAEVPEGWRTLEGVYARVHAHPEDLPTARHLARHAEEAVPRIAEELGLPPGRTIDIFLAPDERSFDALQPGLPPDWADGTAWPARGLVFLHSPRARPGTADPLEQVLDHEIVHVVLGRAFGPRPVPRWLQEGTAQLLAREYTPELTERLSAGVLGDNLLSLDEITRGFPIEATRARLAYAQSADLVAFLRNEYGEDGFRTLVFEMARGQSVEQGLNAVTGLTMSRLDQKWRSRLQGSGIWLQTLVSDTVLLGGTGMVFVVLGGLAHRKRKARLARMAEEDRIRDALYASLQGEGWEPRPPLPLQNGDSRWLHPEPPGGGLIH